MQFRVPQFLDIEDKIFGPFTFKQFGYLLGAIAFAYIFWKLVPYAIVSFPLILIFSGTFLALAFVKINNRPFADVLESAYKFIIGDKILVWHKSEIKKELFDTQKMKEFEENKKKLENKIELKVVSQDKIKDLSKRLDILNTDKKEETEKNFKEIKASANINTDNANLSLRERLMKR